MRKPEAPPLGREMPPNPESRADSSWHVSRGDSACKFAGNLNGVKFRHSLACQTITVQRCRFNFSAASVSCKRSFSTSTGMVKLESTPCRKESSVSVFANRMSVED
jgi:hypothetical protein